MHKSHAISGVKDRAFSLTKKNCSFSSVNHNNTLCKNAVFVLSQCYINTICPNRDHPK